MLKSSRTFILSFFGAALISLFASRFTLHSPVEASTCSNPTGLTTDLLAIYILAFDNAPLLENGTTNPYNLTPKYDPTITHLKQESTGLTDRQALVLADRDTDSDTVILHIYNGTITTIDCLPNAAGDLDPTITEYDTTDGETLGGFLLFANNFYSANRTTLSYIGHGSFFAPEIGEPHSELFPETAVARSDLLTGAAPEKISGGITPLPDKVDINPDYTDYHLPNTSGKSLITPYDLALALDIGTNNGNNPIDVLDVLHCFGASVEELYELHPYATYTTASPNYAYFDPEMPGDVFKDYLPNGPVSDLAQTILTAYYNLITGPGSNNQNPSVLIAVENSQFPAVKTAWDNIAQYLLGLPPTTMTAIIDTAYLNSAKYDTTYCTPEFELTPPDALSDIFSFAEELKGNNPTLDNLADQAQIAAFATLPFAQFVENGQPWYGGGLVSGPIWTFEIEPFYSIFTPFQLWQNSAGEQVHVWQSLWYTNDTLLTFPGNVTLNNPRPYQFIQGTVGGASWADLVEYYWTTNQMQPGIDNNSVFCTPFFPELYQNYTAPPPLQQTELYLPFVTMGN